MLHKEEKQKSPSQRLRATIYRLWEEREYKENFETFYERQIENIIEIYKSRLERK